MQQESQNGFWDRLWAALSTIEGQNAEEADMRLNAVEREVAELKADKERSPEIGNV